MKRALQATLDHVDDTVESVRRQPPRSRPSLRREKSLHEKLYDIYLEECEKEPVVPGLKSNVSLLEKLVRRESLPCLVVNLYPEEEGYSLMLKDKTGSLSEAFHVTCVKERLLEFLDAKELPPVLIDVLEKSPVNVFQQGCVIAEVRDYRLSSSTEPAGYQSQYTLLRPTMQTLAYDVATMTSGNSECTQEEKLELESQLILATAEPLCLDPSASVTLMSNGLLCNEQKMKTDSMRQSSKRHAWSSLDVEKPSTGTPPPDTTAVIVCKRETESEIDHRHDLSIPEAGMCVDKWKQQSCAFAVPSEVDLQKYAEGQPSMSCDDSKPAAGQLWPAPEEKHGCIIKCEDGSHLWVPMPGSDGSMAVIKTEVEEAVDMFQEPVQSKAVYPCPMPQESSSLSSLGLPTSAMMAKSSVGPPSVSEEKEKIHAPQVTLLSRIRQGSSGIKHRTLQVSRPRKLPRLAPAPPKSASQIRNAFGMVGTLLLAAQPSISSDPSSTTGMNVLNLLGLPPGVPVLVSDSSQVLGSSTCTPDSTQIPPSKPPCKAQLPKAQSKAAQHPVNNLLQHIVNNNSCPVTVKTPPRSVILHPQQQPQSQLQHEQPQQQRQLHMKSQQKTTLKLQVNQLRLHKQPQSRPQQQVQLLLQPQQQPQLKLLLLQLQEQAQLQLLLLQPQEQAQLQLLQPQQQAQLQLLQPQQQAQLQAQQQAQLPLLLLQPQQQAQLQPQQQAQLQLLLLQPQEQGQLQPQQQAQVLLLQPQQQAQFQLLQAQQQAQLQMLQQQEQAQLQLLLLQPQVQSQLQQLQPQVQSQLQQLQPQLLLLQPQQQAQLQPQQQSQLQLLLLQPQQQAQLQPQQQAQLQPQQQAQLQPQQQAQEQPQLWLQQWAELQLHQLESEQQGQSQPQQLVPEQQGQLQPWIYEQPQEQAQSHLQLMQQQVELLVQELKEEEELQPEQTQ